MYTMSRLKRLRCNLLKSHASRLQNFDFMQNIPMKGQQKWNAHESATNRTKKKVN